MAVGTTSRYPAGAGGGGAEIAQDLGGTAAAPTVEGLQGEDLPDSAANTLLKRNGTNDGWATVPYSGTNLTTDLAAKVPGSGTDGQVGYFTGTTLGGHSALTFNGAKLAVNTNTQGSVTVGTTTGSNSVQIRGGSSDTADLFFAGGDDHFVTGSVSGDFGIMNSDNTSKFMLTVGTGSQLVLSGGNGTPTLSLNGMDLVKIKNVAYVWPSSNASGALTNNGSGTLSWTSGVALSSTSPADTGATTIGVGTTAAKADHVHAIPTNGVTTAMITNSAVTVGKMANLAGLSVLGVTGTSSATPAAITGSANQVLQVNSGGTGLVFAAPAAAATDITGMTGATNPKALTDYLPTYNAGAAANRKVLVSDAVFSGRNRLFFEDDFMNGGPTPVSPYFAFSNVGGGTGTATHPGVLILTGGNAPNSAYVRTAQNQILLGGGKWRFTAIINTDVLSTGGSTYSLYAGFGDGSTAEHVDGVYFRYTHSVNSGKFELVTSNNSARTAVDTGITLAAATWYTLEIEVNAAGTSAQAYINGSAAGSANTGTMPTSTGRETGLGIMTVCSLGYNPALSVDYISGLWEPTTAR